MRSVDRGCGNSINSFVTDAPHGAKLSSGELEPDEHLRYVDDTLDEPMSNVDADDEVYRQSERSRTAVTVEESSENNTAQW